MNTESELDLDIAPDAYRCIGSPRRRGRQRDYSALRLILAIVLVAFGCALLITSGCPPTVSP
jgi:hypothetical protein